jgi:rubrerythrin
MFRAFMELDKINESDLHESYNDFGDRQELINKLKSIGRHYNFDSYSNEQLFYIWKKEYAKHIEQESFNDASIDYAYCEECGRRLTDGGYCPVCDDGAEDLDESKVKSEYYCTDCGHFGYYFDDEVADGCCPKCRAHHGNFVKCE